VKKIAEITEEVEVQWKYCLTEANLADLGSRGASLTRWRKVVGTKDLSGCWNKRSGQSSRT
jgi:hypothetical protein